MATNSDLKRWYKIYGVEPRDFVRYDDMFRVLCYDAVDDFHAVNFGQLKSYIDDKQFITHTVADESYIHKTYRAGNSNKTLYTLCDITNQNDPDWLMVNTGATFGLGKVSSSGGWTLAISAATKATIEAQSNGYQPITPSRLSDAVVVGLTANKNTLTDAQRVLALTWLGAVAKAPTPTGYAAVYAIDRQGNDITVSYSPQVSSWALAQRGDGGTLFVGAPTDDKHAATKKYVDDLVAELTARIVELESKVN